MSRKKKIIITSAIITVIYLALNIVSLQYHSDYELCLMCEWLTKYIDKHGAMPASEAELIEKGYLKIDNSQSPPVYQLLFIPDDDNSANRLDTFHDYTIGYGIDIKLIEKRGNKLYDNARKQVYLISGIHPIRLYTIYAFHNIKLYDHIQSLPLQDRLCPCRLFQTDAWRFQK